MLQCLQPSLNSVLFNIQDFNHFICGILSKTVGKAADLPGGGCKCAELHLSNMECRLAKPHPHLGERGQTDERHIPDGRTPWPLTRPVLMAERWTVGGGGERNLHMERGHSPKDEFNGYIATLVPTDVYTLWHWDSLPLVCWCQRSLSLCVQSLSER